LVLWILGKNNSFDNKTKFITNTNLKSQHEKFAAVFDVYCICVRMFLLFLWNHVVVRLLGHMGMGSFHAFGMDCVGYFICSLAVGGHDNFHTHHDSSPISRPIHFKFQKSSCCAMRMKPDGAVAQHTQMYTVWCVDTASGELTHLVRDGSRDMREQWEALPEHVRGALEHPTKIITDGGVAQRHVVEYYELVGARDEEKGEELVKGIIVLRTHWRLPHHDKAMHVGVKAHTQAVRTWCDAMSVTEPRTCYVSAGCMTCKASSRDGWEHVFSTPLAWMPRAPWVRHRMDVAWKHAVVGVALAPDAVPAHAPMMRFVDDPDEEERT
jgi:hypothetical protein